MAKQDATGERAARLAEALRRQRESGGEYPLTVAKLKELADAPATDEEMLQALTKKAHAPQFALANNKDLASPVALAEDRGLLTSSPLLLEYALKRGCNADKPLQPINKVVGQVEKGLREDFEKAIQQRAGSGDWPASVGSRTVKDKLSLYLQQFPPPPLPVPKRSPAAILSEKLVNALKERKAAGGDGYPPSAAALLAAADPEAKPALLKRAMVEEPFLSEAVAAVLEKPAAPVALTADREALADGPVLLEYLLSTVKKHPVALAELAAQVSENLRPLFVEAVRGQAESGRLPDKVGTQTKDGALLLFSKEKLPPEAMLRDRLLGGLMALRDEPGYPPTLAKLLHMVGEGEPEEVVGRALADKAFRSQVVVAVPDNRESPLALKGDEEKLATSTALLEMAVGLLSTAEQPLAPLNKVAGKLDRGLREAFLKAVEQQVQENKLPDTVASEQVKGKPHLRLSRYRPMRDPVEELVEKLMAALRAQRQQDDYPPALSEVLKEVGGADEKVVTGALESKLFKKEAVVVPVPGSEQALVALMLDRDFLAGDDRLLEGALQTARTADDQAIELGALKKKVAKTVQAPFGAAVEKQIAEGDLPNDVGCLRIKGKPYLFLLDDVSAPAPPAARTAPGAEKVAPPRPEHEQKTLLTAEFAPQFDEAFARLDRERGGHNHVSLVQLRAALPVERTMFDAELRKLRQDGRYSLSGAEGRFGVSAEEREAGIMEEGTLLLFVARRS